LTRDGGFCFSPLRGWNSRLLLRPGLVVNRPRELVSRRQKTQISHMKKISLVLLALASIVVHSNAASNYVARVVSYNPGVGIDTRFTNIAAVLGEPSRVNPYTEAVDPFNP